MGTAKPRLLIVDDEPDMLDFLERVFRNEYEVTRASNADAALEELGKKPHEVVITDLTMPQVTGMELLERIGQLYPSLVRVLLSGFAEVPELSRKIERSGIHKYVVKPVDSEKLRAAVQEAIVRARGASG